MTISEYVQAHRIRQLRAGRDECADVVPLACADGALVEIAPHPSKHEGPWHSFDVTLWHEADRGPVRMQANELLELLESHGWPEAQLGRRWRKPR